MAEESAEQGDTEIPNSERPRRDEADPGESTAEVGESEAEEEETDEDEVDEEDEPKLKYARLTSHLGPLYRNGDATSTFLVAGDKMVGLDPE